MTTLIILLAFVVMAAAVWLELYFAKRKSWLPGLLLPCVFVILLILCFQYGYPTWQPVVSLPPDNIQEHWDYLAREQTQSLLFSLHGTVIASMVAIYIHERRKRTE